MLTILAPSKTMDFTQPAPDWVQVTSPLFGVDAEYIMSVLGKMNRKEISQLMRISSTLADELERKLQAWGHNPKPALWAYRGDVYKGMYADTLSEVDVQWAQSHLRIMSGLYGVLRPTDAISSYRLEMAARVPVGNTSNLYAYWGTRVAQSVDKDADGIVCVLSSAEYAKIVTRYSQSRVITPVFMDHRPNGTVGPVPIYSKMMRGVMARWIVDARIDNPEDLSKFSAHGYVYDPVRSSPDSPAFVREVMRPLQF